MRSQFCFFIQKFEEDGRNVFAPEGEISAVQRAADPLPEEAFLPKVEMQTRTGLSGRPHLQVQMGRTQQIPGDIQDLRLSGNKIIVHTY